MAVVWLRLRSAAAARAAKKERVRKMETRKIKQEIYGKWRLVGKGKNRRFFADIVHAVASIPKTFMLGIRDKRYEANAKPL